MPKSKMPDKGQSTEVAEPAKSHGEELEAAESYRNYNESERPLLRSRAQRALRELSARLDEEASDEERRELESSIEHLQRIVKCMADEPLPAITAEALETGEWLEYDDLRFQYSVTGSMPMLLCAFVGLVKCGISPGKWILEPLSDAFDKILEDEDPDLVASRLGLQAKGSGSSSPLQEYARQLERTHVYFDMRTLIEEFGLSRTKAAEAVIDKFELKLKAKTLVNSYEARAKYPQLVRKMLDKYSDGLGGSVVWLTEDSREQFLASFPSSAQKFLKGIRPVKT